MTGATDLRQFKKIRCQRASIGARARGEERIAGAGNCNSGVDVRRVAGIGYDTEGLFLTAACFATLLALTAGSGWRFCGYSAV
jgi:hypothetical protein